MNEWFSRGYLPHRHKAGLKQHITFHLYDSIPDTAWSRLHYQLELLTNELKDENKDESAKIIRMQKIKKIEGYLDAGYGSCLLKNQQASKVVKETLLKHDGLNYNLLAWCVMPSHVHVLVKTTDVPFCNVVHSWKSFTAKEINSIYMRSGRVWHREYFDRFIRDEGHLKTAIEYIESNPVNAKLVAKKELWPFSSAWKEN